MPYIHLVKPHYQKRCGIFAAVFFTGLLLSIGGCGRELEGMSGGRSGSAPAGVLSIPPNGFVRIVSRQIQDGDKKNETKPETLHYKWSLIGERNWQNPKADQTGFTLGDVYPLNSTTRRGGCNIWECDLIARSTAQADMKTAVAVEWQLIIHGSNGQTARTEGRIDQPSGGRVEDAVRVVQTRDEPVRLPTDVILARVGEQNVRLRVAQ